jgi:hypothetical protein
MTYTIDELRELMRRPSLAARVIAGQREEETRPIKHANERVRKVQPGACWAYQTDCAKLRGKVPTCHDSGDPRCAA